MHRGRQFAEYDPTAATQWFSTDSNGSYVTALQHNSGVIAFAMLLDSLSNPVQVATHTQGSDAYRTVSYNGPLSAYSGKKIPACGIFGEPSDADVKQWFCAVREYIRRIGDGYVCSPGTQQDIGVNPTLWAVFCEASEAVIPARFTTPGMQVLEDPNVALVRSDMYKGVLAYTARLYTQATTGVMPLAGDDETKIVSKIAQLSDEYGKETNMARVRGGGLGVVAVALDSGARAWMPEVK